MTVSPLAVLPRVVITALISLATASLSACATTRSSLGLTVDGLSLESHSYAGPGEENAGVLKGTSPPLLDEDTRARAQNAETERALNEMQAVVSSSDAPGTRWEFRYWAEGGALTGREYLAMRERTLLEAQEGMREGMIFLASFSLEQVASVERFAGCVTSWCACPPQNGRRSNSCG